MRKVLFLHQSVHRGEEYPFPPTPFHPILYPLPYAHPLTQSPPCGPPPPRLTLKEECYAAVGTPLAVM